MSRIWGLMKSQDYANQSQDDDAMMEADANIGLMVGMYKIVFEEDPDVRLGPTFVPRDGKMRHIKSYEDEKRTDASRAEPSEGESK